MREGWKEVRIKDFAKNIGSGATPSSDNELFYDQGTIPWINTGDLNDSYIIENKKDITELAFDSYPILRYFNKDTVIIALYGATIGKLGILTYKATVNQACCCISLYDNCYYKFLFYFLFFSKQEILRSSFGGTQPNISQKTVANILITLPPLSTQHAIANYLDKKLAVIDRQISLLEKKRDRYTALRKSLINQTVRYGLNPQVEMQDSGIECLPDGQAGLGKIPKHWEVKRVKELGKVESSGIDKKIIEDEELIKIVNYIDVYNNKKHELYNSADYMVVSTTIERTKTKKLKKGDLLLTPSSETVEDIGISSVVMEDLIGTLFSYHILRIQFTKNIDINFKKYVFNNSFVQNYFSSVSTGTTRKILSLSKIYNLKLPIPPLSEQRKIAEYLDIQSEKIDSIIENINRQLGKLAQLKKSLINECVTGEREVDG